MLNNQRVKQLALLDVFGNALSLFGKTLASVWPLFVIFITMTFVNSYIGLIIEQPDDEYLILINVFQIALAVIEVVFLLAAIIILYRIYYQQLMLQSHFKMHTVIKPFFKPLFKSILFAFLLSMLVFLLPSILLYFNYETLFNVFSGILFILLISRWLYVAPLIIVKHYTLRAALHENHHLIKKQFCYILLCIITLSLIIIFTELLATLLLSFLQVTLIGISVESYGFHPIIGDLLYIVMTLIPLLIFSLVSIILFHQVQTLSY